MTMDSTSLTLEQIRELHFKQPVKKRKGSPGLDAAILKALCAQVSAGMLKAYLREDGMIIYERIGDGPPRPEGGRTSSS